MQFLTPYFNMTRSFISKNQEKHLCGCAGPLDKVLNLPLNWHWHDLFNCNLKEAFYRFQSLQIFSLIHVGGEWYN